MRAAILATILMAIVGRSNDLPHLVMPAWLKNYGDAAGRTTSATAWLAESTYETAAAPAAVIAHYGKLFQAAGLPFHPNGDGMGVTIRGAAAECDLLIAIRGQGSGSSVRVSCARRETAAASPPEIAPAAAGVETVHDRVQESMQKYDRPVQVAPHPPPPPEMLIWPPWLTTPERTAIDKRDVQRVGQYLMRTSFRTGHNKAEVRSFYIEQLESHGFPVRNQSPPSMPARSRGWVDAVRYLKGPDSPHVTIRVEFTPLEQGTHVELQVAASSR